MTEDLDAAPADGLVGWASDADEARHALAGFHAAELEQQFVAYAQSTPLAALCVDATIGASMAVLALQHPWDGGTGFGYGMAYVVGGLIWLLFAATYLSWRLLRRDEVRRARAHEYLTVAAFTLYAAMGVTTFHFNRECVAYGTGPVYRRRTTCDITAALSIAVTIIYCVACNARLKLLLPALVVAPFLPFAALPLADRSHAGAFSDRQVAVLALVLAVIFATAGVVAYILEQSLRRAFIVHKRVVRLTEETRVTAAQISNLLQVMLPPSVLMRLMAGDTRIFDVVDAASVSFSDVAGFTNWSATRTSEEVVQLVSTLVSTFDAAAKECQVAKVKTIGDAYWAQCGLPESVDDCSARICDFALRQQELLVELNHDNPQWRGVALRVGCHTGPLVGGVIGTQQLSYEVFGETNHIAECYEQHAPEGGVLVSPETAHHAAQHTAAFVFHGQQGFDTRRYDSGGDTYVVTRSAGRSFERRPHTSPRGNPLLFHRTDDVQRAAVLRFLGLDTDGSDDLAVEDVVEDESNAAVVCGDAAPARPAAAAAAAPAPTVEVPRRESSVADGPVEQPAVAAPMQPLAVEVPMSPPPEERLPLALSTRVYCVANYADARTNDAFYAHDLVEKHAARQVTAAGLSAYCACAFVTLLVALHGAGDAAYREAAPTLALYVVCAGGGVALCLVARHVAMTRTRARAVHFGAWALVAGLIWAPFATRGTSAMASPEPGDFVGHTMVVVQASLLRWISPPADVHVVVHVIGTAAAVGYAMSEGAEGAPVNLFAVVMMTLLWYGVAQPFRDRALFEARVRADVAAGDAAEAEQLQRRILRKMAPPHVQDDMVALVASPAYASGRAVTMAHTLRGVTICFCEIRTDADMSGDAHDVYAALAHALQLAEKCLGRHRRAVKIKTVGALMVVAGPLEPSATAEECADAAADIVQFALESVRASVDVKGGGGIAKRCGVCTGDVVAAVMGTDRIAYDIFGDPVNTASRCMTTAIDGTVQLAQSTLAVCGTAALPSGEDVQVFMKGKGAVKVRRSSTVK
jgi:class 3 adenylate cyclase